MDTRKPCDARSQPELLGKGPALSRSRRLQRYLKFRRRPAAADERRTRLRRPTIASGRSSGREQSRHKARPNHSRAMVFVAVALERTALRQPEAATGDRTLN